MEHTINDCPGEEVFRRTKLTSIRDSECSRKSTRGEGPQGTKRHAVDAGRRQSGSQPASGHRLRLLGRIPGGPTPTRTRTRAFAPSRAPRLPTARGAMNGMREFGCTPAELRFLKFQLSDASFQRSTRHGHSPAQLRSRPGTLLPRLAVFRQTNSWLTFVESRTGWSEGQSLRLRSAVASRRDGSRRRGAGVHGRLLVAEPVVSIPRFPRRVDS